MSEVLRIGRRVSLAVGCLVAAVLLAAGGRALLSRGHPSDAPRLSVDSTEVDLGTLRPGSKATGEFRLENVGSGQLVFSEVRSSCGCAPAKLGKSSLDPEEAALLTVDVTASEKAGPVSHTVFLSSNDAENPSVVLSIHAQVQWAIAASVPQIALQSVPVGREASAELELFSPEELSFEVTSAKPSVDWIEVSTLARAPRRWRFLVRVKPPDFGVFSESVQFSTTCDERPWIVIPIQGEVVPRKRVAPSSLLLGSVPPGAVKDATLLVEGSPPTRVAIGPQDGKEESREAGTGSWEIQGWQSRATAEARTPLDLKVRAPIQAGYHRASVRLDFPGEEKPVLIPISCYVDSPPPPTNPRADDRCATPPAPWGRRSARTASTMARIDDGYDPGPMSAPFGPGSSGSPSSLRTRLASSKVTW